jgi:spore coat protein U-like protein
MTSAQFSLQKAKAMTQKSLLALLSIIMMAFGGISPAHAQLCGIQTLSGGNTTLIYDPFSPTPFSGTTGSVTLGRINPTGGGKTAGIDFYLVGSSATLNGSSVTPISIVGGGTSSGLNQDIFFDTGEVKPPLPAVVIRNNTPLPPRVFRYDFTGNNQDSDSFTLNFNVTLPSNLNLIAGGSLSFDVVYRCSTTGAGGQQTLGETTRAGALTYNIQVLNGLAARYAGAALDFGEIGDKPTSAIASVPAQSGNISIASSGPYEVKMTSANGYRLSQDGTVPSGASANTVDYQINFMGETRSPSNRTIIEKTCARAGVGAPGNTLNSKVLPVTATLIEGGQGKTSSAGYLDTLTVTLTPITALPTGGAAALGCPL